MRLFILLYFVLFFFNVHPQGRINNRIDSLEASLDKELAPKDRIFNLNQLADLLMRQDTSRASKYANEAIRLSRENRYAEGEADALEYFARSYTESGQLDTALIILNEIICCKCLYINRKYL